MSEVKEYPFHFEWNGEDCNGQEVFATADSINNISVSKMFDIAKDGIRVFEEDHSNVSCKVKNLYTGEEQIVS